MNMYVLGAELQYISLINTKKIKREAYMYISIHKLRETSQERNTLGGAAHVTSGSSFLVGGKQECPVHMPM